MKTQLFIKEITNVVNNVKNPNFTDGITNWYGGLGITFFKNNAYLDGSNPANAITQDIRLLKGNYKVIINVVPSKNGDPLVGALKIQLGNAIKYVSETGQHTLYFNVTSLDSFWELKLESVTDGVTSDTFNGGIGFISVEGISGDFKEVELYDNVFIPITHNISDVKNFVNRQTTYSSTIKIPGSHSNNNLFRHIYNVNTDGSFNMNTAVECYILYDGLNIFEGSFELLKVKDHNGIFYEGLVYSDFGLIFNKINNKTLRDNDDSVYDLDFSEYTQELGYDNIVNSWSAPTGEGVVYAPIDKTNKWGLTFFDDKSFKISEMTPCLYIKEIWDKIFEKAGFTYDSEFLESDTFKKLVYPHTDGFLHDRKQYDFTGSQNTDTPFGSTITADISAAPHIERTIGILDYIDTDYDDGVIYNDGIYEAVDGGEYNIKIDSDYKVFLNRPSAYYPGQNTFDIDNNVNFGAYINLKIERVDGSIDIIESGGGVFSYPNNLITIEPSLVYRSENLITFNFEFNNNVYLEAGDKIYVEKRVDFQHHWSSGGDILIKLSNGLDFPGEIGLMMQANTKIPSIEINKTATVLEGTYFNPTKILHTEFKQTDFIKSIIRMFNLYAEPISEKHLKIEPYSSFMTGEYLDWTDKIDLSQEISIERANDIIESNLSFKYATGKDDFNVKYDEANTYEYGSFHYRMPQNNSDKSFDVEVSFAPTAVGVFVNPRNSDYYSLVGPPEMGITTSYISRLIIPKIFKVGNDGNISTGEKYKPRILFWNGLKSIDPYRTVGTTNYVEEFNLITEIGSNTYSFTKFPYFSNLDEPYGDATMDLNFGHTAWNWEAVTFPSDVWTPDGNLFNLYYKDMIQDIGSPKSKLVKMKILLNEKDITDIAFDKMIFIKDTYYRLNKISNVIPNKFADIELISVTDATIKLDSPFILPDAWEAIDVLSVADLIKDNTESGSGYIGVVDGNVTAFDGHSLLDIDKIDPGMISTNPSDTYGLPIKRIAPKSDYNIDIISNSTKLLNGARPATLSKIKK